MAPRVMLVDDYAAIRIGVRKLIETHTDMEVVGQAENGRIAVERAAELRPDIIIMDVSMPEMSGVEATRLIKAESPYVQIIAYSSLQDPAWAAASIDAGASRYVCKDCPPDELIWAIEEVLQEATLSAASVVRSDLSHPTTTHR